MSIQAFPLIEIEGDSRQCGEQYGRAAGDRPGVEPDDEVDLVGTCRQDQDRRRQALVADLTCDVQAVHVREAQVEHDDVDTVRGVDRSLTSSLHDHVVTLTRQRTRQRFGNRRVVLR